MANDGAVLGSCYNAQTEQIFTEGRVRGHPGEQLGAEPWLLAPRRPAAGSGTCSVTNDGCRHIVVACRLPPLGCRWLPHRWLACLAFCSTKMAKGKFSASRICSLALPKAQNLVLPLADCRHIRVGQIFLVSFILSCSTMEPRQ